MIIYRECGKITDPDPFVAARSSLSPYCCFKDILSISGYAGK